MEMKGIFEKSMKIDIDDDDILDAAIEIIKRKNKKLIPFDYIDNQGNWQQSIGVHPHNGEEMFRTQRKATSKEIDFMNFIKRIEEFI